MKRSPTTLFLLGLASLPFGPLAGIPGILIGRKMAQRGVLGDLGYLLCWAFTVLFTAAALIGFIAAVTMPIWHR